MSLPSSSSSTPKTAISTPSKIITISTPLRPCSRAKAKEMQDDIKAAVDEQSVPMLRVALQRRHPCLADHALHEAIRQSHLPAVRLLLNGRSDPNARCLCLERGCEFPLQLATSYASFFRSADRRQVVELLLVAGAQPSPRRTDAEANTPLHEAVRRGDSDIAHLLLRHSADPNTVNGFGETPLHLALRHGSTGGAGTGTGGDTDFCSPLVSAHAMAELLLQAGACPLGPAGGSGLPAAADMAEPELRRMLERWAAWWRRRTLAWIRSRGQGHPLCTLAPELCLQVASFL